MENSTLDHLVLKIKLIQSPTLYYQKFHHPNIWRHLSLYKNTRIGDSSSTKKPVQAVMHNNPSKNHTQEAGYWGKVCLKRKVFSCLQKGNKDGASLASCGRKFQNLGPVTESPPNAPERKACPDDPNTWVGTECVSDTQLTLPTKA